MAAIVYALINAMHLTYGANNIRIYTDHQPLISVGKKGFDDIDNPRLAKMFELIYHYNFELAHTPGKKTSRQTFCRGWTTQQEKRHT